MFGMNFHIDLRADLGFGCAACTSFHILAKCPGGKAVSAAIATTLALKHAVKAIKACCCIFIISIEHTAGCRKLRFFLVMSNRANPVRAMTPGGVGHDEQHCSKLGDIAATRLMQLTHRPNIARVVNMVARNAFCFSDLLSDN